MMPFRCPRRPFYTRRPTCRTTGEPSVGYRKAWVTTTTPPLPVEPTDGRTDGKTGSNTYSTHGERFSNELVYKSKVPSSEFTTVLERTCIFPIDANDGESLPKLSSSGSFLGAFTTTYPHLFFFPPPSSHLHLSAPPAKGALSPLLFSPSNIRTLDSSLPSRRPKKDVSPPDWCRCRTDLLLFSRLGFLGGGGRRGVPIIFGARRLPPSSSDLASQMGAGGGGGGMGDGGHFGLVAFLVGRKRRVVWGHRILSGGGGALML